MIRGSEVLQESSPFVYLTEVSGRGSKELLIAYCDWLASVTGPQVPNSLSPGRTSNCIASHAASTASGRVVGVPTCLHGAVIIRDCDGQRKARPFAEPSREGASDPRYHRRRWPLVLLATKEFFRSQSSLANVDLKYGSFLRPPPESVTALDQGRRQCTTPLSVVAAVFPLVCPCKEKNDTFPQCAVAYRSEPRCTDGGETDHLKHVDRV